MQAEDKYHLNGQRYTLKSSKGNEPGVQKATNWEFPARKLLRNNDEMKKCFLLNIELSLCINQMNIKMTLNTMETKNSASSANSEFK